MAADFYFKIDAVPAFVTLFKAFIWIRFFSCGIIKKVSG